MPTIKLSKRQKQIQQLISPSKSYSCEEAVSIFKKCPPTKFKERIDVSVNLSVDARKSDQVVRGAAVVPNGTGRIARVAVFAKGEQSEEAQKAGADKISYEDLAESIKKGEFDYDVIIATSEAMKIVGQLGPILGPRGLMPNPKVGTVTNDLGTAVKNAKGGQVRFRTEKAGIVHCAIGDINFEPKAIKENLETLLIALKKAKPSTAKGTYLKKVTLSTTMGPGVIIDLSTLDI